MREIKFRAWDLIDNLMYYNVESGVKFDDNSEYSFNDFLNNTGYHNWAIMQYTGLKDKNGVEVYEGDIVKAKVASVRDGVNIENNEVKFEDGMFVIADDAWHSALINTAWSCEIIGNIYENKELINVDTRDKQY